MARTRSQRRARSSRRPTRSDAAADDVRARAEPLERVVGEPVDARARVDAQRPARATGAGDVDAPPAGRPRARRAAAPRPAATRGRADPGQGVGRARAQHRRRRRPRRRPRRSSARRRRGAGPRRSTPPAGTPPRARGPRRRRRPSPRSGAPVTATQRPAPRGAGATPAERHLEHRGAVGSLPTSRLARPAAGGSSQPGPRHAEVREARAAGVLHGDQADRPPATCQRRAVVGPLMRARTSRGCPARAARVGSRAASHSDRVGAAEQPPAAGRGRRVDAAPRPGQRHRAGRHPGARRVEPGHGERRRAAR